MLFGYIAIIIIGTSAKRCATDPTQLIQGQVSQKLIDIVVAVCSVKRDIFFVKRVVSEFKQANDQ